MRVIFSTYQSMEKVAVAPIFFDLIIFDETSRNLPPTTLKFSFTAKKLYMTATSHLYKDDIKRKAADRRILTNVGCLSEGVDVPSLDAN